MKNPCIDPSFVKLEGKFEGNNYILFEDPLEWSHETYNLVTSPIDHNLCGPITYKAFFMDDLIDSSSNPLSYDSQSNRFTFYSEDLSLIGKHRITVRAELQDYLNRAES